MSLLTHNLATKNFREGLNTLEIAQTVRCAEFKKDEKIKFVERLCRFFSASFATLSQDDLLRAVDFAITVPSTL